MFFAYSSKNGSASPRELSVDELEPQTIANKMRQSGGVQGLRCGFLFVLQRRHVKRLLENANEMRWVFKSTFERQLIHIFVRGLEQMSRIFQFLARQPFPRRGLEHRNEIPLK